MKTCTKCKIEKQEKEFSKHCNNKDGLQHQCKTCNHNYAIAHSKHIVEKIYIWKKNNPDKVKNSNAIYRQKHPGKDTARMAEWRRNNPEKDKEKRRAWQKANPDKMKQATLNWQKKHPESLKANNSKRRARKVGNGGCHTGEQIKQMFFHQKGRCFTCGDKIDKKYHIDHITPICKGGTDDISNIQLLCPFCNMSKNKKTHHEFMVTKGMLV